MCLKLILKSQNDINAVLVSTKGHQNYATLSIKVGAVYRIFTLMRSLDNGPSWTPDLMHFRRSIIQQKIFNYLHPGHVIQTAKKKVGKTSVTEMLVGNNCWCETIINNLVVFQKEKGVRGKTHGETDGISKERHNSWSWQTLRRLWYARSSNTSGQNGMTQRSIAWFQTTRISKKESCFNLWWWWFFWG